MKRALAIACVLGVGAAAAYASLVLTPSPTADSNTAIAASSAGRIVFSVRNGDAVQIMITGFTQAPPAVPGDGCAMMTIARLDGGTLPVTVGPGQQAQFVVTTNGFATVGDYGCTWLVDTAPVAMIPQPQVVTTYHVAVAANLDVQPKLMDFGSQTVGSFETQRVVLSNYLAASQAVNLTITPNPNIAFTGTCGGTFCGNVNVPAGAGSASVDIKCQPTMAVATTATLLVMGSGGSAMLGSAQLSCDASAPGGTITIGTKPNISIVGPPGSTAFASTMIFGSGATLGSATIASLDGTMLLSDCGAQQCTYAAQPLPYSLQVQCIPTASASTTGTLTVHATGGASDQTGITCVSGPLLSAGSIGSFGGVLVGAHADMPIDLTNIGGQPITNLVIAFGINGSHWTSLDCTPASPCSIAAQQTITAMIRFQPTTIGDKSTMMQLTSNAPTVSVPVSGTGLGGVMAASPMVLDIGQIPRGAPYSRTVTLAQGVDTFGVPGNWPYTATASGLAAPYTVSPVSVQVDPLQTKDVTVTCESATPTATNNEQTLSLASSDAYQGSPQLVTVRCKIADTVVQVMPNQFDFGEVRIDTDPDPRTIAVTITNPAGATAAAHVASLQLRKAIAGLALVPAMTDVTLAPGASTSATLQLSTGADTTLADEYIDIAVDATMLSFPVTGKVVTPHARVAPRSLELGTACTGTAVSGTVKLINDGTATLAVESPHMDGSFIASSPNTPAMLAPKLTLGATVAPAVSGTGPISGTLSWYEDTPYTHLVPVTLEFVSTGTALSPKGLDFGILDAGLASEPQHITLQNCDPTPTQIKVSALRAKQGALAAWTIDPRLGYQKDLRAGEVQTVDVTFSPGGRGVYEAELEVTTAAGPQTIQLVGEATGRDYDNTSLYACSCAGGSPAGGLPVLAAFAFVSRRRRRV